MRIDKKFIIIFLVIFTFIVRIIPLQFPAFSSDEARVAFRAFALSTTGKDELGRSLPLLFNSLEDYQLPVVSYTTALGALIFGKTDFGVRVPFILIGTAVVFLIYKLSGYFFEDERYGFYAAAIASLSPGLIFFSKFPNESIIATFLILLLITQLLSHKVNKIKFFQVILLMLLTSKILWLILVPVLIPTLFLNNSLQKKEKINLFVMSLIPLTTAILLYLIIPQASRSLIENNFSIINDVTVKNGIERLRSQTVWGWPVLFDRFLFNKTYLLITGIFHWFSQISLGRLFTEFDTYGYFGFLKQGAFSKILVIPFLVGLFTLIRGNQKIKFLFLYILITTFPLMFLYPVERIIYIVPALPFIVLISSLGFKFLSRRIAGILIILLTAEFVINLLFLQSSIKNANEYRPGWIKQIVEDAYAYSANYNVAFSDNIAQDMVPLIEWYKKFAPAGAYEDVPYPYRFRQTKILNYKIIGSEDNFYNCGLDKNTYIFASKRDLEKIQLNIKVSDVKSFRDLLGNEVAYLLPPKICVH